MNSIKNRLAKLESIIFTETEPLRIARFIVEPGIDPIGYSFGDIKIIREPRESIEALHKRCFESANWTDVTSRHIFNPLVANA